MRVAEPQVRLQPFQISGAWQWEGGLGRLVGLVVVGVGISERVPKGPVFVLVCHKFQGGSGNVVKVESTGTANSRPTKMDETTKECRSSLTNPTYVP